MKLLVDENLSARIADALSSAGHDAVHVTAVGLGSTDDEAILDAAASDGRVIVTAECSSRSAIVPPFRSRAHLVPTRHGHRL